MKRKIFTSFILLLALVLTINVLAGCDLGSIYDDDAKIAKSSSNYSASIMSIKRVNSDITASAKKFSGACKLADIEVKSGVVIVTYSCKVTEGRFKLVAVKDGEVHVIFESEGTETGLSIDLPNGKYRLKLVGDKTDFKLSLSIHGASLQ